ncbi:response regulator [Pontiella agarivorans]|uniref:Response regulator n=1 Tax=Pontiella agarivorans TaxID=3038953 RepID=A0ABU5MWY8_9BACT|nr:response regulator [Pontiella agarivorans]MDZ8118722.1 response regulator [Pontiella agarivorans]
MNMKKILLVEDDIRDVELAISSLEEHNLANEVAIARDGVEALDYLYRRGAFADRPAGHPVVVFLDLKMPKVDGHEVLRRIKNDPELCTIPVVVLTSSGEEQDLAQSYEQHANAYVVKPVLFEAFTKAVQDLGLFWVLTNEPPPQGRK